MNDQRRLPPQCLESEMSVLGGILLDNTAIDTVHTLITRDDFYRESHRKIFSAMAALSDKNEPIDLVTLCSVLKSAGELEEIGGGAYLANLVDYVPTAANIAYYCRIVAEKAKERKLITAAQDAINIVYEGKSVAGAVSVLESAINISTNHRNEPVNAQDSLRTALRVIENRCESKGEIQGMSWGIEDLDNATDGVHVGDLIIIAGRPSMGKTSLALNVIENICMQGESALLFSLEMNRQNNVDKILASHGHVRYQNIRRGKLEEYEWPKLIKASSNIHDWRMFIDDTPAISLREIRFKARRIKKDGLKLIVVDYLQLMATPGKDNRTREIGDISRGLKDLARELDVAVVLLSQLSRKVDERADKRPMMSDLRESGEIEQDADVILFPYRPSAYCQLCRDRVTNGEHNFTEHDAKAEIIIEKQRNGERNISIPAVWMGEYQRFVGLYGRSY